MTGLMNTSLAHDPLRDEHVVEPHELWVVRVVILHVPQAQDGALLNLTEHGEESGLHAVAVERVLPRLRFIERLVCDV